MEDLHFIHSHKPAVKEAYILLHGASAGLESPFMNDLFQAVDKIPADVLAIEFPFVARNVSPTPNLQAKVDALNSAIIFLQQERKRITIIAKSLGGIVASKWLAGPQREANLYVLGHVLGEGNMQTQNLLGKLKGVIQGEFDKFGNAAKVQAELSAHHINTPVVEVPGADHSYCNPQKNPTYQATALDALCQIISKRRVC
jgi:predicted alpha/beta-hydrolase family hydrolase